MYDLQAFQVHDYSLEDWAVALIANLSSSIPSDVVEISLLNLNVTGKQLGLAFSPMQFELRGKLDDRGHPSLS